MQDIRQETLNECTRAEQSASVVLWEIDLTEVGGERYFFCNEQNEKGEPVTWQGRQYQPYPIQGSGFELNGKGTSTRPTPTETDGAVFPGRIMLANTCTWTYRGDECGYHGPAVADEYDQPTSDITKDKCSKCL
ncbi:phage minor tail protein L, partial [Escherichia coli]|nr:phage minor tail protein L [Escherichia coli]